MVDVIDLLVAFILGLSLCYSLSKHFESAKHRVDSSSHYIYAYFIQAHSQT